MSFFELFRSAKSNDFLDFPPEFDPQFYKKYHPDLKHLNERQLVEHYEQFGRAEGRRATSAVPRDNFLKLLPNGSILEIGPFAQPCCHGRNVKYFDVQDKAGLVERAKKHKELKPKKIPEIDFVSPDGDLSIVDAKFDIVFSSHCIEHQPDLIRHLKQVENILADHGRYFVIVPDKRYCFDHYLPESTIAEVLQAHVEQRTRHTLANVIAHYALTTHNEPARHWRSDNGEPPTDVERIRNAIDIYEKANGSYIDVHALFFTPQSFKNIIALLNKLGHTKLKPARVYNTPVEWNEFCAILELTD